MVEIHEPPTDDEAKDLAIKQLVEDYLAVQGRIKEGGELLKTLGDQIIEQLGTGGRVELKPGVGVRVQGPSGTFNAEKAKKVLTAEQLAAISDTVTTTVTTISGDKAKALFPPPLFDLCKVYGTKPFVKGL